MRSRDASGERGIPRPDLSIAIPTFHRPDGLRRALVSVTEGGVIAPERIELVVSDNSTDRRSERAAGPLLEAWPGPTRYVRHEPGRGMVGNFNACVELSSGRWKHILHDDDYLLPNGIAALADAARRAGPDEHVLLTGVDVVGPDGRLRRRQHFRGSERLAPRDAMARLLRTSSFVRFPAVCVRADAYEAVGAFDDSLAGFTDYDMWIRLFSRFGVTLVPAPTAAYVVHDGAATERIFDADGVAAVCALFERADRTGVLSTAELLGYQRDYMHQFILAGAWRRLRARQWAEARRILRLFRLPAVRRLGVSRRWAAVRVAFTTLAAAGGRRERGSVDGNAPR